MSSNLNIYFFNYSTTTFNVDQNSDANLQVGGNSVISWPNAPLEAISGEQTCQISENLSKIAVGPSDFYFCWNNGIWRFGVKIIADTQVLGMGDRPYWEIMYDQNINSPEINWISNGDSPGDQYMWPTSIGFNIVATPTSGHQSLSINVIVKNN